MINFEALRIKDNDVLLGKEQWNGLLDETQRFLEGDVGLGTDVPKAKLHIAGKGGQNVDFIVSRRIKSEDKDGGLWVGDNCFVGGKSPNKIGFFNKGAWRLVALDNGNVGIGTLAPTAKLHVSGSLTCGNLKAGATKVSRINGLLGEFVTVKSHAITVTDSLKAKRLDVVSIKTNTISAKKLRKFDARNMQYNSTTGEFGWDNSSRSDKRNIKPLMDDFGKIMQLQPRKYTRPFDKKNWEIGYIAEEAEALGLEHLVFHDNENNPDGINYRKLCLYLVEIVREHERKLNPNSPHLEKYIENEVPKPTPKK